jgi:threonine/homoserine efflux transporter RhtA
LLLAQRVRESRFSFAGGMLLATIVAAVAILSFLQQEYRHNVVALEIVGVALMVLMTGIGPFIAAFRGAWRYVASLTCALTALTVGTSAAATGIVNLTAGLAVSAILALASVVIAVLPPYGNRRNQP